MNLIEIAEKIDDINDIQALNTFQVFNHTADLKYVKLNNYIVHVIELINNSFEQVNHTALELNGTNIGDIFYLKDKTFEISSLSEFEFYSFIVECEISDLYLTSYSFKNNYLIIHQDFIDDFHQKYSLTSSLWGDFKLLETTPSITYYKKTVTNIIIPDELRGLDDYAKDSVVRALDQKHSFERFLKFYHLLELEFDYSLIKKIKSLNVQTDSNKIGVLLNEYTKSEIDRLTDLITSNCADVTRLAQKLNLIKGFGQLGEEIFIKFGKKQNAPMFLTDAVRYNNLINDIQAFEDSNVVKQIAAIPVGDYNKFICNITAFWIYRIRCSIAHFKIGEYILTRDKEQFIVEFAEPLIKEVLIQFYKK